MSVSYSEAGAHVSMFSRFCIPLRRRRPHEPSSRPPCRPSPGAVETGGTGAATRGLSSDFHSLKDTILDLLHIFTLGIVFGSHKTNPDVVVELC